MALFDSADLLARCKRLARRPPTDQAMPDSNWYAFLTEAQAEVYPEIFSRFPGQGYSAPVLMTSADGGLTYTFGDDAAGDPIRPTGHAEIYPALNAIPFAPLTPGVDFLIEGGLLRMPANRARTFASGPYARYVLSPDIPIAADSEPMLQPKHARMLLVYKALEKWASRPGSGARPDYYEGKYNKDLNKLFLELATAYNRQAVTAQGSSSLLYVGDFGSNGLSP
jgi:hypothetical protein